MVASGATTTHHHGVGQLKAGWATREVGAALAGWSEAKAELDPRGILAPGRLFVPGRAADGAGDVPSDADLLVLGLIARLGAVVVTSPEAGGGLRRGRPLGHVILGADGVVRAASPNVAAVFEQPIDPPVANFDWNQQAGVLTVEFTDTSSGAPTSWSWNFGDGTSATARHPNHAYAQPGDYVVQLTATNQGGSHTKTTTITVDPPPTDEFAADAFERSVANGWGIADIGGSYTTESSSTSNYNVNNGVGTITLPSANTARSVRLDGVSQADVDIRFRVASNKVLAGANLFVYAVARRQANNEYRPRLILNANGSVSVNASVVANGSESALGSAVVVCVVSS